MSATGVDVVGAGNRVTDIIVRPVEALPPRGAGRPLERAVRLTTATRELPVIQISAAESVSSLAAGMELVGLEG